MISCEQCGTEMTLAGRGRVRRYCSTACRMRAYRARTAVPAELASRDRWVRHSSTKMPLRADTGAAASSTDPRTWTSLAAAKRSRYGTGLGFVLAADGVVCIDLDHCLEGGELTAWARPILDACPDTYIEVSPSGDGLHIWGTGHVDRGRRLALAGGGNAEVYGTGRYITVTGRRHRAAPARLADLTDVIDQLTA